MLYSLVKPILFSLDPELAHDISLQTLQQLHRILPTNRIEKPTRVMGLDFPNPVGLAAGLDKNADYLDRSRQCYPQGSTWQPKAAGFPSVTSSEFDQPYGL
jgi:hypothetical protein